MKFGHHGANHPVSELDSGRVLISSQNHGFAVDEATLPETLRVTHRSLFDGTLQGVARTDRPAFSFQGHPEASPGPHDLQAAVRALHVPDGEAHPGEFARPQLPSSRRPRKAEACRSVPTSTASSSSVRDPSSSVRPASSIILELKRVRL